MNKIRNSIRKLQIALTFSAIVFSIILVTLLVIFIGLFTLKRMGYQVMEDSSRVPIFTFAIVSLLVGTALSFFVSRAPLKPIRNVAQAADRIADGDYTTRINLKGSQELTNLTESFNNMAQELGSVEMLRTDFINNFSHEFKTPIVSIGGFARILKPMIYLKKSVLSI